MTDEEIIAAAGEPVAEVIRQFTGGNLANVSVRWIDGYPPHLSKLYPADAILSAVKPLRERIAELEGRLNRRMEDIRLQAERYVDLETEHRELRIQLNAALEREKVLREALEKLARLGNGDRYGNSEGNVIAQAALALPHDDTALRQERG